MGGTTSCPGVDTLAFEGSQVLAWQHVLMIQLTTLIGSLANMLVCDR